MGTHHVFTREKRNRSKELERSLTLKNDCERKAKKRVCLERGSWNLKFRVGKLCDPEVAWLRCGEGLGDEHVQELEARLALRIVKSPRIQGGTVSHVTAPHDWLTVKPG